MRGFVIAVLAAIVTSSGCLQSQPQAPVEAPTTDEAPSAAVRQPTPAATAANPAPTSEPPTASLEQPAPAATTASPSEVPAGEAPPSAAVMAGTHHRPTAAPPAPPEENTVGAETESPPPTARSADNATAPSSEASPTPATPPVAASTPAESPASPELDLAGLEQRLRDTRAIGVFTKLSLKNQVDDLLDQFRAFYQGQLKVQLPELRKRYELLFFKVLTLLQDSDPELANAIAASREAIWDILTDPQKLANV